MYPPNKTHTYKTYDPTCRYNLYTVLILELLCLYVCDLGLLYFLLSNNTNNQSYNNNNNNICRLVTVILHIWKNLSIPQMAILNLPSSLKPYLCPKSVSL